MKKKTMMKTAAIALAAVMAVPMAGCGSTFKATAKSVAEKAASAVADIKSIKGTNTLNFDGTFTMSGSDEMDLTMSMEQDEEVTADPFISHGTATVNISAMGQDQSQDVESYTEVSDSGFTVYNSSDGGDTWTKSTVEMSDDEVEKSSQLCFPYMFEGIADGSIDAELEDDTQTVDDSECYVLDATLTGDDLKSVLDDSGVQDITTGIDEEDFNDVEADAEIYVDKKTFRPAKVSYDMSDLGDAIFNALLGSSGMDIESDTEEFSLEVTYSSYDDVDEITIPDEALNAEETSSSASSSSVSSSATDSSVSSSSSDSSSDALASTGSTGDESTDSAEDAGPAADKIASAPTTGTADWSTFQFTIDGKTYQIPFAYSDLSSDWSFNLADYGYENGYVTNSGDKQSCTIAVSNPNYDMDFSIGTINMTDSTQDITQNNIWAVSLDTSYADTYPTVTLPGGITWGSSLDEILAAYGKPEDDPYYSTEFQYYSLYYYTSDSNKQMNLEVYVDGGLKAFRMEDYSI